MTEFERHKDQIQDGVQSTAGLVGRIAVIVTDSVAAIAREVGDWMTDRIEMQEAARASRRDECGPQALVEDAGAAKHSEVAESDPPAHQSPEPGSR